MITDVEIAQSAKMKPIVEVAQKVGLDEDDLDYMENIKQRFLLKLLKN